MSTKINLTNLQKQHLLQLKTNHKSVYVRDRAQAVLARNQGLIISNIAKALSRSDDFVKQAIKKFNKGELEKVEITSNNYKLSEEKRKEIVKMIQDKTPNDLEHFKFKEQFWTVDILRTVIKREYKQEYKDSKSYYDLFKLAGFSFHKPKTKDYRQNPEKIKEFKGALKKSSKTTKIRLSW